MSSFDHNLQRVNQLEEKIRHLRFTTKFVSDIDAPYEYKEPRTFKPQRSAFISYSYFFSLIIFFSIPSIFFSFLFFNENELLYGIIFSVSLSFLISYATHLKDYKSKVASYNKEWENYTLKKKAYPELLLRHKAAKEKSDIIVDEISELRELVVEILLQLYYSNTNHEQIMELFERLSYYESHSKIKKILYQGSSGMCAESIASNNFLKTIEYKISNLNNSKKTYILKLLKEVEKIQKSDLNFSEKSRRIKNILWNEQTPSGKLIVGGVLGTATGLVIFGTGGIGIAGLGGAIGFWGFLAGTTGGVLISSLIQNFESSTDRKK